MLFNEYPDQNEGYQFISHQSRQAVTYSEDEAFILGSTIHPDNAHIATRTTIPKDHVCQPIPVRDFRIGNIIAIDNMFTSSEDLNMYILTSPYKVKNIHDSKFKLIPLDEELDVVRLYYGSDEDDVKLSTKVGRMEPVTAYPIPDIILADTFGKPEEVVNRRI